MRNHGGLPFVEKIVDKYEQFKDDYEKYLNRLRESKGKEWDSLVH